MVLVAETIAGAMLGEARHELALPFYHSAARLGSPLALRQLGLYYAEGKEVELDLKLSCSKPLRSWVTCLPPLIWRQCTRRETRY
jgi:TPR repeat protein